ncbi:uncharacterized protein LOC141655257 [Silene latifolia]|uniref:uncharacterized protein LOC141655257 n=1 Tax=Silene latifolia TaxID=37657 RepID=UPI003D7813FE
MACVTSPYYSLLINGEVHGFFPGKCGLRQGDPLSPYLFVICMEVLSRLLRRLPRAANFSYHPKCVQLNLTHLVFADDLLVFTRGDLPSVKAVADCIDTFSHFSGLHANLAKTDLYFRGVAETVREIILNATGFSMGAFPFRYLGLPLFNARITQDMYQPLLDKIKARIMNWANHSRSYAGKALLALWISTYVLKGASLWDAQQTISNSWYWTNVLKMKDLLLGLAGSPDQALHLLDACTVQTKYCTDTMYGYIRTRRPLVPWAPLIHGIGCHPKHSFTGVMVMNNGLPTVDKLISRGMCFINRCALCERSCEDIPHLFFNCDFSKRVLTAVAQRVQMPLGSFSLNSTMQAILPTRRNVKYYTSLLAIIYYLRKVRNDRIFKGSKSTVEALTIVIRKVVTLRLYGSTFS